MRSTGKKAGKSQSIRTGRYRSERRDLVGVGEAGRRAPSALAIHSVSPSHKGEGSKLFIPIKSEMIARNPITSCGTLSHQYE